MHLLLTIDYLKPITMKKLTLLFVFFTLISLSHAFSQNSPKEKGLEVITIEAIKAQLEFLASDWTEGRETGTRGIYMSGDYVASMFKFVGAKPGGDMGSRGGMGMMRMRRGAPTTPPERSYFQNFTLLQTLPGGSSSLVVNNSGKEYIFQDMVDFTIPRANASAKVSAPVIFVGYGIDSKEFGINDFAGVDVRGKVVLRLSGYPGQSDQNSEMYKKFAADRRAMYMLMRSKNVKLAELGALAVIDITPGVDIGNSLGVTIDDMNLSPNESTRNPESLRFSMDNASSSGPISITVTQKVIDAIMTNSGINIDKIVKDAATGTSKFKAVDLKNVKVNVSTEVKKRRVKVRNVVALIEGEKTDEFIVVGAHMDHLGMSGGKVWNGADDNASGTVGVMTIARAFAATGVKPKRTVIFCAWTGEEKGLFGSTYWASNPSFGTIGQCKFYLNYDMIARDAENDTNKVNVGVTYNKDYPYLEEISVKNVEDYGLKMNFQYRARENPTGGSDHTAFTNKGVPIQYFMAAMHPEYHTPADHIDLVNWDKMLEIIKLGFLNMWDIANSDF